jgi:hypothetical protein
MRFVLIAAQAKGFSIDDTSAKVLEQNSKKAKKIKKKPRPALPRGL